MARMPTLHNGEVIPFRLRPTPAEAATAAWGAALAAGLALSLLPARCALAAPRGLLKD
ncbi:hypothetical protein [Xanthobacter sediminis]